MKEQDRLTVNNLSAQLEMINRMTKVLYQIDKTDKGYTLYYLEGFGKIEIFSCKTISQMYHGLKCGFGLILSERIKSL